MVGNLSKIKFADKSASQEIPVNLDLGRTRVRGVVNTQRLTGKPVWSPCGMIFAYDLDRSTFYFFLCI